MFRKHLLVFSVLAITAAVYGRTDPFLVPRVEDLIKTDTRADEISYRLPNNTKPIHYDVFLETFVDQANFNFNGNVKILVQNRDSFPNITLHYRNLTINEVRLWTDAATPQAVQLAVPPFTYHEENEFFVIHTAANLIANNNYTIDVIYNGILRVDNGGFYRSSYRDNVGNVKWLATTQFESTNARHAYPCYDEPALKATYSINIKHGASYKAISNMPTATLNPTPNPDGSVTTSFQRTPRTSSYLIAFIVSDFASLEKTGSSGIAHRVFARPNAIDQTHLVLEAGEKILDAIGNYLSLNYTLPKMDQAAIPDFSPGAMENWGLVTYREERFFYDERVTTYSAKTSIITVIAHEFGHQWFGNLVGPEWWSFIWLNEGFATLFEYVATDLVYPDWTIMDYFLVNTVQNVFNSDSLQTTRPMTHYVESPGDVSRIFDNIAYAKSGSVLRQFLHAFSEKSFRKGLNYYLNDRAYNEAAEGSLFAGLEKAVKEDNTLASQHNAASILSSWTRQAGYPVLHVKRNYEKNTIELSQERYLQSTPATADQTKWWIPVNYATTKDADFSNTVAAYWLPATNDVTIFNATFNQSGNANLGKSDWVVLNKQATGYYRVKYDQENYDLITEALRKNATVIHLGSRSQLLDDAAKFAQHDKQKWDIFLSLARYLVREHEYVPWQSAINALSYLDSAYSGHASYPLFTEFVRQLIEHLFEHIGVSDVANEPHLRKYARTLVINWACRVGSTNCTTTANNAVKDLIRTGQEFHQNVRGQLYCAGLRTANETEYKAIWNRLVASTNVELRNTLFTALGCTRNATLLHSYLSSVLPSTNSQNIQYNAGEAQRVVDAVYQSGPHGVRHTIDYLIENLVEASTVLPNLNNTIVIIADRINSQNDLDKFRNLTTAAASRNIITAAQVSAINTITASKISWTEKYAPEITKWLVDHPEADGASSVIISTITILSALVISISRLF